ncbi:MAG: hypothetical protein U0V87_11810 [Acidobacteriota bacterium]
MQHAGQDWRERLLHLRSVAAQCGGDDLCEVQDSVSFLWLYGSTMVEADIDEDGEIVLHAWLVIGPTRRPQWTHLVTRWEGGLPFGELLIDDDGDVILAHRIPISTPNSVMASQVREFCREADRLDDLICQQLGGIRSIDQFHRDVIAAIADEALEKEGPAAETDSPTEPQPDPV